MEKREGEEEGDEREIKGGKEVEGEGKGEK